MTERPSLHARWSLLFGLGAALGPVLGHRLDLALDTGNPTDDWLTFIALCLLAGSVPGAVIASAPPNRRVALVSAAFGAIAAVSFIILLNTGDTAAVAVLVGVGSAAAIAVFIPDVTTSGTDGPGSPALVTSARAAVSVLTGVGVGAGLMFVNPAWPWANVSGAGGIIALFGAIALTHGGVPTGARRTTISVTGDRPTSILLSVAVGLLLAVPLRFGDFVGDEFQAGIRYQLLVVSLGALGGALAAVTVAWHRPMAHLGARETERTSAALCLVAGLGVLFASASETLPGVVIGVGTGIAVGSSAVTLLRSIGPGTRTVFPLIVSWALATITWPYLTDAVGSERWTIAVAALPAVTMGAAFVAQSARTPTRARAGSDGPTAGESGAGALLSASGVEFSYGGVQVLFGVDITVRPGEIVALVGANGAGKTTFLRTLAGLERPSGGTITLGGQDLEPFAPDQRVELGLNLIASGSAVAEDLTVSENLTMFGFGLHARDRHAGIARAYEQFPRLAERKSQKASLLSGGERQMLALAKALILKPRLLVIDELSMGLAPIVVSDLIEVVRRIHRQGTSVLLVEQSVNVALELADRAFCMEKGTIVFESTSDALRADEGLLESVYLEGVAAALEHRMVT